MNAFFALKVLHEILSGDRGSLRIAVLKDLESLGLICISHLLNKTDLTNADIPALQIYATHAGEDFICLMQQFKEMRVLTVDEVLLRLQKKKELSQDLQRDLLIEPLLRFYQDFKINRERGYAEMSEVLYTAKRLGIVTQEDVDAVISVLLAVVRRRSDSGVFKPSGKPVVCV